MANNQSNIKQQKKNFTKKRAIILSIIAMIFLCLSLFSVNQQKKSQEIIEEKVIKQDLVTEVITSGQLKPYKVTTIGAQVSGEIQALYIKIGDKVKKGQLIAELDPTVQKNNLNKAKDNLVSVQADLSSLQRKLVVAKKDLDSYSILYKNGAVSRSEYDKYVTLYKEISNNIIQAKARVNQAKLDVDNMTKNFSYTKINAPISGVIVSLPVEVGQTLTAGYSTPTIATIADIEHMTIQAEVSEADIYNIRPGQKANFTVVGNLKKYSAEIDTVHLAPTYVSDNNQRNSNSTYYYTILNVNEVDENFRINMTVTVHIITNKKENVLCVSNTAITEKDGQKYVVLLDKKGNRTMRVVKTGFSDNIKTEIISGLHEGDTVVKESVALE